MQENLSLAEIKKKTLLGIDYGTKRIGLAIKEKDSLVASPFKIIHKINELDDIVKSKQIDSFVIGMPFETSGNMGKTAQQVQLFSNRLKEKFNLPIYFTDERYTSQNAKEKLNALCVSTKRQKDILDNYAAIEIIKRFLSAYDSKS